MRISQKTLESAIRTMNSVSNRPQGYEKGAFILGAQNGGYSIDLLMESGGQKRIFGTEPASLLHAEACAWIAGREDAEKDRSEMIEALIGMLELEAMQYPDRPSYLARVQRPVKVEAVKKILARYGKVSEAVERVRAIEAVK